MPALYGGVRSKFRSLQGLRPLRNPCPSMMLSCTRRCRLISHGYTALRDRQCWGRTVTRKPRRRRVPSILVAEDMALERDPGYLAQMRARKAMLQAQAALLRAQEPCLEVAGAAD